MRQWLTRIALLLALATPASALAVNATEKPDEATAASRPQGTEPSAGKLADPGRGEEASAPDRSDLEEETDPWAQAVENDRRSREAH
jgi:hypothetical protein